MNTDILSSLYKQYTKQEPQSIDALPGAGSNRRYYRLDGVQRLIGVCLVHMGSEEETIFKVVQIPQYAASVKLRLRSVRYFG